MSGFWRRSFRRGAGSFGCWRRGRRRNGFLLPVQSDSARVAGFVFGDGAWRPIFLARNVGNVVPITSQDVDGVSATIEYAVEVLRVKEAIICGHSDCGAMKAALGHTALEGLPKAERWLNHVEAAFAYRQPLNPADGDGAELASLIRGNVVAQLMNLRVQPSVKRAVAEGRLKTHGWYYDILSGKIECYDEKQKKFVPLVKPGSEKRGIG